MSRVNKSSYYPRTRATIVLLYQILATTPSAMISEGNITYEGNISGKPDRILPCAWNVLTQVKSEVILLAMVIVQGNMTEYYPARVQSAMLHASETWPLIKPNLQGLQWNDRAMIRQICNVRRQDIVTTRPNELLVPLSIEDLDLILKERRLHWYGYVEHFSGAVKAFHIQVEGKRGPGRPKMTWKQLTERDCREWKLLAVNPHDRHTWRSGVRSVMRAASQLSGRGPTDVDVAPAPAC